MERLTPKCCKTVQEKFTVVLCCPYEEIINNILTAKPQWRCRSFDEQQTASEVKFCPHCGETLPDVAFDPDPNVKYTVVTDSGYYCDTCNERLSYCTCTRPEFRWRIVDVP